MSPYRPLHTVEERDDGSDREDRFLAILLILTLRPGGLLGARAT